MRTGVLIGTGMPFFVEGLDLHTTCSTTLGVKSSFQRVFLIACSPIFFYLVHASGAAKQRRAQQARQRRQF